jgi:hypothetical protein
MNPSLVVVLIFFIFVIFVIIVIFFPFVVIVFGHVKVDVAHARRLELDLRHERWLICPHILVDVRIQVERGAACLAEVDDLGLVGVETALEEGADLLEKGAALAAY